MSERSKIFELFDSHDWETRAKNDIEAYRKGNARITVLDQNGDPVKNAKVKVVQTAHAFRFGANIFMLDELETEEKNKAYKKHFADLFNMATLPFYWQDTEPEKGKPRYTKDSPKVYRRPAVDLCLEFCKEHGIEPREHALAYEHFFPEWLRGVDTETAKTEIERHFAEIAERYADKIDTIEVTNEMFWTEKNLTDFYFDPEYVEWCFKTARKYFPNNKLSINEMSWYAFGKKLTAESEYMRVIRTALEAGAPIDAIGMQMHFFQTREEEYEKTRKTLDPENIYHNLDMLASFGKPLQLTEVTLPSYTWDREDEEIQADMLEKLYTLWFSHPKMEQIIYWNLVDGYAYVWSKDPKTIRDSMGNMTLGENIYRGGLLRFDMTPKAAYYRLRDLIQKVWHTEEDLISDENGNVAFRGFYGDYKVLIESESKVYQKEIALTKKADGTFTVII